MRNWLIPFLGLAALGAAPAAAQASPTQGVATQGVAAQGVAAGGPKVEYSQFRHGGGPGFGGPRFGGGPRVGGPAFGGGARFGGPGISGPALRGVAGPGPGFRQFGYGATGPRGIYRPAAGFGPGPGFVGRPAYGPRYGYNPAGWGPRPVARGGYYGVARGGYYGPRRGYYGGYYGPRYGYYGRRYYRDDYGAAAAAGLVGLATGAIVGSAIANSQETAPAGYSLADYNAYCSQRYRSFDPASGTFLGYDGRRHRCVLP